MFLDGLEDAYDKGRLMGTFAEDCAREPISSPASSRTRSRSPRWSAPTARFATAPSPPKSRRDREGRQERDSVATDEQPPKARPDKIPTLKPAFRDGGTVTAANSSSISDGAAALILDPRRASPTGAG